MASVTINGNAYNTYATVAQADAYLAASISNDVWSAATPDQKAIYLVESARVLDRQNWKPDFDTFQKRSTVEGIINGSIELAALFAAGETDSLSNASTSSSTKRLKAGSAEVEYFKSFETSQRFPTRVMELVGKYLGSSANGSLSGAGGAFVSGVSQCSQASQPWGYWSGI